MTDGFRSSSHFLICFLIVSRTTFETCDLAVPNFFLTEYCFEGHTSTSQDVSEIISASTVLLYSATWDGSFHLSPIIRVTFHEENRDRTVSTRWNAKENFLPKMIYFVVKEQLLSSIACTTASSTFILL
jgi:hypothetical protein